MHASRHMSMHMSIHTSVHMSPHMPMLYMIPAAPALPEAAETRGAGQGAKDTRDTIEETMAELKRQGKGVGQGAKNARDMAVVLQNVKDTAAKLDGLAKKLAK